MLRFIIRLAAIVVVASLPVPLHAQAPPVPPAPPPAVHAPAAPPPPPPPPVHRTGAHATATSEGFADSTAAVVERIVSRTVAAATHAAAWNAMSWKESWEAKQGPESTERISKSFKIGANGSVDIANISGDITINEGGGDTVTIDAVKRFRGKNADAKAQFAQVQVTMVDRGGRVEVKTTYDRNTHGHKASVDYTVTTPAGSSVYAHNVSGDIKVTSIKGEVRIDTISGDATAIGTPGATLVKTVSGNVNVSGVSNANELRASTISGDVTVTSVKVRALDADSISGTVYLNEVMCERATAKSISGNIAFGGALSKGGRYEFKSQSGDVRVMLAGTPGFELDASSFSGSVRSDLPITLRAGEQIGRGSKRVRGTHGDGSASVVATSFSGSVVIAKR